MNSSQIINPGLCLQTNPCLLVKFSAQIDTNSLKLDEIVKICCLLTLNTQSQIFFPEPEVQILGYPELYVKSGSQINLTCIVKNSIFPYGSNISWKYNHEVSINSNIDSCVVSCFFPL